MNSTLTRSLAFAAAASLAVTANAGAASIKRNVAKPAASVTPVQVLNEGGTLAALAVGNMMDQLGAVIGTSPNFRNTGASLSDTFPNGAPSNGGTGNGYLYDYASIGTGGSQADFVNQNGGGALKSDAAQPSDYYSATQNYETTAGATCTSSPVNCGFFGAAGTTVSTTRGGKDALDFAAGDAPIPLGPCTSINGTSQCGTGVTSFAASLATYNNSNGLDTGYNKQRGPANQAPWLSTGLSIIVNETGLTVPSGGIKLTQNDLCGIFTGKFTNWNQTSQGATIGNHAITIVHRSDGSGSTFLMAYDLSQICSSNNTFTGTGKVSSANYWNQAGFSSGVGTDSNNYATAGGTAPVVDNGAPEVMWPNSSVSGKGSGGLVTEVEAVAGSIGYVSPSYVPSPALLTATQVNVENQAGNYEPANATTVQAAFSGTIPASKAAPTGYPQNLKFYYPFPTQSGAAPLVGYTFAYTYECYPENLAKQVTGLQALFSFVLASETGNPLVPTAADKIATNWQLNYLTNTVKASSLSTLSTGLYVATSSTSSHTGTYQDPTQSGTSLKSYTCTPGAT
jgi:ABC-type phosphate transport system substrate-binding protein